MDEAKKTEPNDPNALSLATADKNGRPSVRIVLLKDFGKHGFIFYTNLDSPKSLDIESNPKAEMCFYWKSLQRQVRVFGSINKVADNIADKYFSSRDYTSKISAWASEQSKILQNKNELLKRIDGFKKTYPKTSSVPRPENWSGWILEPIMIEFWLEGQNRTHERLRYYKELNNWIKKLLNP
jgi:pyridoxamine 5'-phosphate oxidase